MPKRRERSHKTKNSQHEKMQISSPLFNRQEIEDLRQGILEIDCPKMSLKKQSHKDPCTYKGPGYIKQSLEGQFSFKLYSNQKSMPDEYLKKLFSKEAIKSGQVIPGHEYYDLKATDLYGRKWKSKRILAKSFFGRQERGIVLTGEIRELTYEIKAPSSINKARLNIKTFDKIDIPANKPTTSTKTVEEKEILKSFHMNSAEFISCGNKFFLTNEDDLLNVSIVSDKDAFEKNIEMRVIEALQFILARPIRWSILEKSEGKAYIVRIQSKKRDNFELRSQPPINHPTIDYTGHAWKLYDKYLRYILRYKEDDWHPLSSRVYQVILASGYSFFTQALILCTTIEGVLKEEFSKLAHPSSLYLRLMGSAQKHMNQWEKTEEIKQKIKHGKKDIKNTINIVNSRINGLFGLVKIPRVIDTLRVLVQSGAIKKEHVDSWKKLRSMTAHAYSPKYLSTQEFIDDFYRVLVLFHHLIFHAIDYKGKYCDYSLRGFPLKDYPFN